MVVVKSKKKYEYCNNSCVSIVIPAYNHGSFLSEAIDSVLQQDYSNIELIVLDDGSTDSTVKVLESYTNEFYWESHENIGQANTLNKGWKIAKGDVLSYLSADDILEANAVSASLAFLNEFDSVVMTYCDFNLIDESSNLIMTSKRKEFNYKDMLLNLDCVPGPGVFFKRNAYEAAGPWSDQYKQMPDLDFWLRLGLTGDFKRVPEILANFRVHDDSQTCSKPSIECANEPVCLVSEYFKNKDIPGIYLRYQKESMSAAHMFSMQLHLKARRYISSLKCFVRSIMSSPWVLFKPRIYKIMLHGLLGEYVQKCRMEINKLNS